MTRRLLASGAHDDSRSIAASVPVDLKIEDGLRFLAMPVRRVPFAMVAVLIGSLAVHAFIVALALMTTRSLVAAPQREIPVEIVQDVPKPTRRPTPEPQRPKVEQRKPEPKTTQTPPVAKPPTDTKEIEALQKELAELRAQHQALKMASASPQADPPTPADKGPMVQSSRAVALPSVGDDGELVGYQDLVFSQLAKAKGIEDYHGQAGTTGVRFELDAAGRLLSADIAVTSGNPALDARALDIVHRAAPFPPPPQGAEHRFFANVNFVPPTP